MMRLAPISVKHAIAFCRHVHRRLPNVQGGMWAVQVIDEAKSPKPVDDTENDDGYFLCGCVGVAIVGHADRLLGPLVLSVLRVAVLEGHPNVCSMLYGSCSRMAKDQGADDLVTYTHLDELGTSLIASGWVYGGLTEGGEHDRPGRRRRPAVDPGPTHRWWAPWGRRAREGTEQLDPEDRGLLDNWKRECARVARYLDAAGAVKKLKKGAPESADFP